MKRKANQNTEMQEQPAAKQSGKRLKEKQPAEAQSGKRLKEKQAAEAQQKVNRVSRASAFRQTHRNGVRLLRVVRQLDRNLLPVILLQSVLSAVIPYVPIFLSAKLIDQLLGQAYRAAAETALVMAGILLAAEIFLALLKHTSLVSRVTSQDKLEILIRKKAMELDYTTMEDTEVLNALRNAESAAKYTGGLGYLARVYGELLQHILALVTAVVMTVVFCLTAPQKGNGILLLLAHPAVTGTGLFLAWICGMFLTRHQSAVIKKMEDNIAEEHYKAEGGLAYWLEQILYNIENGKTIRVNGMAEVVAYNQKKFEDDSKPLYLSMGEVDQKKILSEGFETGIFSITAYLFVLLKVLTGAVSIGAFTKYAGALLQFNTSCSKLVWAENVINRVTKNLVPLADFLDRKNQMETGTLHVEKRNDHYFEIEFHDVGFRYPGTEEFSLRHVNLKLTPKQKMAVVGPNGAGKSTFIKLLCRLYEPTEGSITLNGIDIRKYDYEQYLELFGVVFQNFHLFGFPVKENVAVSHICEEERVEDCLKKAGVWEFVSGLPAGADTVIENGDEDGVDISGGQAQKLSIARALYKDAPFVILDEPTAALDPVSEAEIYERFHEMVEDKTSVYISHRMSSCRFCEQILVFDKGEIKERGSHEELLAREGLYHSLWNAQAQYYE